MDGKRIGLLFFSVVSIGLLPGAMAATFYVKNTNDAGAGSYRDALAAASAADSGPHRILFKLRGFNRTIVLESGGLEYDNSEDADLEIVGQKGATVDGASTYRILNSISNGKLSISDLRFQNGLASNGSSGGALQVTRDLLVRRCRFAYNQADSLGGAIHHPGAINAPVEVYIEDTLFEGNTAEQGGAFEGHFLNNAASTVAIIRSQFQDNRASGAGGAVILGAPQINVVKSTFERNRAGSLGGALMLGSTDSGLVSVVQSAFFDNESDGIGGAMGTAGPSRRFEIRDSIFKRNRATNGGGAFLVGALSDLYAIYNSWFEENESAGPLGGGAIHLGAPSPSEIVGSTFIRNHTQVDGGAIAGVLDSGLIEGSLFEGNSAEANAGAVMVFGTSNEAAETIIRDSSFGGNQAGGAGGAIGMSDYAKVRAQNVTLTNNQAGERGGGVSDLTDQGENRLTLVYSTVVDNVAAEEGANLFLASPLVSHNSVIALPRVGANCAVPPSTGSFNFVDDDGSCMIAGSSNRTGKHPRLNPLRDNGGPVPTRKPRFFSPLIDAIDTFGCYPFAVDADARGVPRPQIKGCDIGAVERK